MSNKTLIPALKARVGDWNYYVCIMKYAEVARQVQFAHELQGPKDLHKLIQRGLSDRTGEIVEYLKKSKHRFLGALIVAAYGGDPHYMPVKMDDPDGMLSNLDDQFGVLTFDGTQSYFALDGQHRLKAIKDALTTTDEKLRKELCEEDISVILVSHFDTEEGRTRTRRLFTNINRNAKTTTKAENIALDEDDPFAIITRRLIESHGFFSAEGRVIVFTRVNEDGEMTLAAGQVPKRHKSAVTTIGSLYELVKELKFLLGDLGEFTVDRRPTAEMLDVASDRIGKALLDLFESCGSLASKVAATDMVGDIRAPKGSEGEGHPFLRPVIQRAVCQAIATAVGQNRASFKEMLRRLGGLDWRMAAGPWTSVAHIEKGVVHMQTGRDHVDLLNHLLMAHLYPATKEEIRRALAEFKSLKSTSYEYSLDDLATMLPEKE